MRYKTGTNDWNTVEVAAGTRYKAEMLDATTTYRFEVSAYGDGTTRRADWGAWSTHLDTAVDPPPQTCTTALGMIEGATTANGEWTADCLSTHRTGKYAKFFTFELAAAAELTIELVSRQDPYLFLVDGQDVDGAELAHNDDSNDSALGSRNSRIVYIAPAGTYTAEATTYYSARTGDFTITIEALSEPTEPTIVEATPGDGEIVVTWGEPERTGEAPVIDYQVQYGTAASGPARSVTDPSINWRLAGWQSASSARTKTITGLTNGTTYYVAVQARNDIDPADGDGALSEPITAVPVAQVTNTPPSFALSSYSINVSEDTPSGGSVGLVAATDDMDTLTYSIGGTTIFAINSGNGNITAARSLAGLGGTTYTMTVTVTDNVNTPVTVDVEITVDLGAYPTLSAPGVSEGEDGGSIDASFILPHRGFRYRLALYHSEDGDNFAQHGAVVELSYGAASPHNFGMLDRSLGGWYQAGIKACRDAAGQQCDAEEISGVFSFPVPVIAILGLDPTYDNVTPSDEFMIDVSGMTAELDYLLLLTTSDSNLGFDANCNTREVHVGITLGETTLMRPDDDLYFCGPVANGSLTAKVMRGNHVASSESFVVSVAPDTPENVIINGDNRDVAAADRWRVKVGWSPSQGATKYKVYFREECYPPHPTDADIVSPVHCTTRQENDLTWSKLTVMGVEPNSNGRVEYTVAGLRPPHSSRAYRLAIKAFAGEAETSISTEIIGFPTDDQLTFPTEVATVPLSNHWPPQPATTVSRYDFVFCNEILTHTKSTKWKTLIIQGFDAWITATTTRGFWTGNSEMLFAFGHQEDAMPYTCGSGETDGVGVNEVKVLPGTQIDMVCGPNMGGYQSRACVTAPQNATGNWEIAEKDMYFNDNALDPDVDAPNVNANCKDVLITTVHEAGHLFGLGHSNVVASMMTARYNQHDDLCGPTYYDVSGFIAIYQSIVPE